LIFVRYEIQEEGSLRRHVASAACRALCLPGRKHLTRITPGLTWQPLDIPLKEKEW
jgi:hypothetical protein